MRLAIYGGTFNPIHLAHVTVAEAAFEQLELDRLLLVPAAAPPHKRFGALAPAEHRLNMAKLVAEGHEGWDASDIELERRGPSYSIDTVREVAAQYQLAEPPYFLIGADTLHELATWKDAAQLVDSCRFAVAGRPGCAIEPPPNLVALVGQAKVQAICERTISAQLMDISSCDIRARVAKGQPIERLVPKPVADYIRRHGLYG